MYKHSGDAGLESATWKFDFLMQVDLNKSLMLIC